MSIAHRRNQMNMDMEITYTPNGIWHRVEVPTSVMIEVIKSGLFENRPVHSVKMWTITGEDEEQECLVYDKSGGQPWRMTQ